MKIKTLQLIIVFILMSALHSGCAAKKTPTPEGVAIEKTLQQAESDARAGNVQKASSEIEEAEKALRVEDRKKPYVQGIKTESGINPKATADQAAIRELHRAKGDARGKLAGDTADDIDQALKDVKTKEGD